jgi:hypothetical protein
VEQRYAKTYFCAPGRGGGFDSQLLAYSQYLCNSSRVVFPNTLVIYLTKTYIKIVNGVQIKIGFIMVIRKSRLFNL